MNGVVAKVRWILALASLAAIAAATLSPATTWGEAARGPSPLIYPRQTLPLTFDHAAHLARGATCGSCHAGAALSTASSDDPPRRRTSEPLATALARAAR